MLEKSKILLIVTTIIFSSITLSYLFVVRPIDTFNTREFLYYSSFFYLSLNPSTFFNIPTPPIFSFILFPQFLVYMMSTNLELSSFVLALINLFSTIFSSLLIMNIIMKLKGMQKNANSAFYMLMFSPFLFFINFIFVEQDIVAIFLTLSSFYLLYFHKKFTLQLAGVLLLAFATFFYYFPILVIPSLFVYKKSWKERSIFIVLLIIFFSFFYFAMVNNVGWSILGNGVGAISTSGGSLPLFSILNILPGGLSPSFTPLLSQLYTILSLFALILVISVPVISKLFEKSIVIPLLISFSVPFLFLKIYNGDEFIWILPFITIAIAYFADEHLLKTKLLISQIYLLPVIIIINMWAAPNYGYGTGFFYFTYPTFHLAVSIYSLIPMYVLVTKLLAVCLFFVIVFNIVYVMVLSRKKVYSEKKVKKLDLSSTIKNFVSQIALAKEKLSKTSFQTPYKPKMGSPKGKRTVIKITTVIIFLIFIMVSILSPFRLTEDRSIVHSSGEFPVGLFQSSNDLMVKGISYHYLSNNSFIKISNYTGSIVPLPIFSRNVTDQTINMNMEIIPDLPEYTAYCDLVGGFNGLDIYALNQINLNSNFKVIKPSVNINLTSSSNADNVGIMNMTNIPVYHMSGSSIEEYNISLRSGSSYLMGFYPKIVNYSQNLLFNSRIGKTYYELFYIRNSLFFAYLSNGLWKYDHLNILEYSTKWNVVSVSIYNNSISFFVDNINIFSANSPNATTSTSIINVGMAESGNSYKYNYSYNGYVTSLLAVNSSSISLHKRLEVSNFSKQTFLPFTSNNVTIKTEENKVNISSSKMNTVFDGNFSIFWFGRNYQYSPGISYALNYISITTDTESGLFLRFLIILYIIPLFVIGIVISEVMFYRNRNRSTS